MSFINLEYFLFVAVGLVVYYIMPKKIQWVVLLLMSYVYYLSFKVEAVVYIIFTTLVTFAAGLLIEKAETKGKEWLAANKETIDRDQKKAFKAKLKKKKKALMLAAVVLDFGLLAFVKYTNFFIENINGIIGNRINAIDILVPLGISFYTFQAMSYIIDVYRKDSKAQQKILPFAVYITMFPQLIAGPIVRYEDIERQLTVRRFSGNDFSGGVLTFIKGLAQKVILANCIGAVHTEILGMTDRGAVVAWIGAIAYTLQIFNDFAGYSNMAIGLGKMLGFTFPKNFDRPYASTSVTEFWRRWHISLSTWFKEYLYIPLGGNRKGKFRQVINLLIVWSLTGLWHGAAWNFVAWGLYYGILLILEKFVLNKLRAKLPKAVNWLTTFIIVIIGWVFFFSNSFSGAADYLGTMFGANGFATADTLFYLLGYIVIMILGMVPAVVSFDDNGKKPAVIKWIACILLFVLSVAFLVSESYNPFLYFRF